MKLILSHSNSFTERAEILVKSQLIRSLTITHASREYFIFAFVNLVIGRQISLTFALITLLEIESAN